MTDIKKIDEEPVEVPSTDNLAAAQQVAEETATEINYFMTGRTG